MTPAMRGAMHAVDVITEIRLRLEHTGGVVELYQLARFSVDELDLLVALEAGDTHRNVHSEAPRSTGLSLAFPQGCASSTPQGGCAPVTDMENYTDGIRAVA